jgi:hypothetical protein
MKILAYTLAIVMAAFTAISIAFADSWSYLVVMYVGPIDVSTFDLLFGTAVLVLLVANALFLRKEPNLGNRLVLGLCWTYVGYQLLVVLPVAVLVHGMRPVDALRGQEVRLALMLIPIVYSGVLRHMRPQVLIAIMDCAAVGLLAWVLYRYVTQGPHGYVESGVFRLRAVWGGGILLFGWLLLTSLFYWRATFWRFLLFGLALVGIGLANHRAGLLASVVAFVVAIVALRGVGKRAMIALVVVIAVSSGIYLVSSAQVRESVAYSVATVVNPSSDQTAQDRLIRSSLGLTYFAQNPLGDYLWNRSFYSVNLGKADFVPHNFVVQLLVTQGVIAAGLYFAIIGATLFIAWRNRHDRLSGVMLAYLVFYLTFCLLNANIDLRENVSLFFISVALVLHQNAALAAEAAPSLAKRIPAGAAETGGSQGAIEGGLRA